MGSTALNKPATGGLISQESPGLNSNWYRRGGGGGVALGGGGGGGGIFRSGGNMNLQILVRQNLCHLLKNERTNYVWFPIIAHEKHWALAMPNGYRHKSLKIPNKLRTKLSYSI